MPIARKDLIQKFKNLGFSGPYSGERHQFMVKGEFKIRVPNPPQAGDVSDALLSEILRQAGISKDEWGKA